MIPFPNVRVWDRRLGRPKANNAVTPLPDVHGEKDGLLLSEAPLPCRCGVGHARRGGWRLFDSEMGPTPFIGGSP